MLAYKYQPVYVQKYLTHHGINWLCSSTKARVNHLGPGTFFNHNERCMQKNLSFSTDLSLDWQKRPIVIIWLQFREQHKMPTYNTRTVPFPMPQNWDAAPAAVRRPPRICWLHGCSRHWWDLLRRCQWLHRRAASAVLDRKPAKLGRRDRWCTMQGVYEHLHY